MMDRRQALLAGTAFLTCGLAGRQAQAVLAQGDFPLSRSEAEWRDTLTAEQFHILREAGTEYPGTSPLLNEEREGTFACAGCGQDLFASGTKYDSRTGWPSFWAPIEGAVGTTQDKSLGMVRIEVHCGNCGGHLGHIFNDGPRPTGLRYCINGLALSFRPAEA